MTKKELTSVFLLVCTVLLISSFSGCITNRETFRYDGMKRTYILHLPPSYTSSDPLPLVIVFHGGGGNAENIERVTNFSQKADEEEFIVVYPDGTGRLKRKLLTWNCGFCCGYSLEHDVDDVGYIKALVEYLQEKYAIDQNMIYATGISNGGIMSYRVGAELSDIFAAIAPVATQIGGQATKEKELWRIPIPEHPISVIAFNGMNDTRVPYDGGRPIANDTHVYSWMSTNDSISFWVEYNQCNVSSQRNISKSRNIIIDTFADGIKNTEVSLVSIVNGTHSWPGGQKGWDGGPKPTKEISATDMMWEFFKNHPKKPYTETRFTNHDGLNRSYRIYVPANSHKLNALLLALHGGGGTAEHMEKELTRKAFNNLSEEYGFIVVYPDGINHRWNDGRIENNPVKDVDDLGFLTKLIESITNEFTIDPDHVFCTGISNGGQMSYRLACERTNHLTAIAPVVSSLHTGLAQNCNPSDSISVFPIAGTDDPLIPFEGGKIRFLNKTYGTVLSMNETIQYWVEANNCSTNPHVTSLPDTNKTDGCTVTSYYYPNEKSDSSVLSYIINGGGHTWPDGGKYFTESLVGRICYDFNACEHIWDFFKLHLE